MKSIDLVNNAFKNFVEARKEVKNSLTTLVKEMQGNAPCIKFNDETTYPVFTFRYCDMYHSVYGVKVTPNNELLVYTDDSPYEDMEKEADIDDSESWFAPDNWGTLDYDSLFTCLKEVLNKE